MYFWLCFVIVVLWLWLSGGTLTARRKLGTGVTTLSILAWTGLAGLALLFIGPYWHVVYQVFGQPG